MLPRLARFLAFALIPAAVFLALFHPAVLDIANAGWLIRGSDGGENALGLHAWLHDPASGAALRTTMLNAPDGASLLFTDSNPLIALMVAPFAAVLPADAQFVGWWLLACCVLQAVFAWALLRNYAPGMVALWCGVALMCALPTWFNRYVHANLFAHWMILAALWLFVSPRRAGNPWGWAALLALAALVHNYLLLMVAAIWGSALLEQLVAARTGPSRAAVIAGAVATVAAIALIVHLHGVGQSFAVTGSYGAFAMPLDALWNPANPGYGTILPAIIQREGRGYEGFQYLGLGLLLMLVAAAIVSRRTAAAPDEQSLRQRLRWLAPALVALVLLAVSNFPDIAGHRLPRFPLPDAFAPVLDTVRASGRLFWPVAYTLVFLGVLTVYRLGRRGTGQVLLALLAVQVVDLAVMTQVVRAQSVEAGERQLYARTRDPRWDQVIAQARDVTFAPPDATRDLELFQEIAWRATSIGRPVRLAYTARVSERTADRLSAEQRAFESGQLDPERLYVVLRGEQVPDAGRDRLMILDGVRILRPEPRVMSSSRRPAS
ncbi:MAG: hypothetical protein JSR79_09490 [Proteobacteria bacterium]|nr:hypothetical protein [Pseudomonadota bacterium]